MRSSEVLMHVLFLTVFACPAAGRQPDTTEINKLLEVSFGLVDVKPDSAYRIAEMALRLARKVNFQEGIAKANMRMGGALSSKGQNRQALPLIREAFKIRKAANNYSGAAGACITLSYIYNNTGSRDSAFGILYEALKLSSKAKDSLRLAKIYFTLSDLSVEYNDNGKARTYLDLGINIAARSNALFELAAGWGGMGNYYFRNETFQEALKYFLKCDSLLHLLNADYDRAVNMNNVALTYVKLSKFKVGTRWYRGAAAEYERINMQRDMAIVLSNLGLLYEQTRQYDSSLLYLQRSKELCDQIHDPTLASTNLEAMSAIYSQTGDYKKAFLFGEASKTINDSLLNAEKVSSLAEMQTKYETELKEEQIKTLDNKNRVRSVQRNASLAASFGLLVVAVVFFRQRNKINIARKRSDELLLNILPAETADELKRTGAAKGRGYDEVTVLFTDFKNFTSTSEQLSAQELVNEINYCFSAFDRIIGKYGIEKIKTIGDSYMCAGGLPVVNETNALDVVNAALDIRDFIAAEGERRIAKGNGVFEVRIGVHTGPVVAGVVGIMKFAYDIWGDTVNIASRMESAGVEGRVNVSEATWQRISDKFEWKYRGEITPKNKGPMKMYFVDRKS